MIQHNLYGYICTDAERIARRYIAPVSLVVIQIVACFFFFKVFQSSDIGIALALAVSWIVFTICLIVSYCRVRVADRLAFHLEKEKITNSWPKDNKIELDLCDSYFCALFTCTFAYGKASKKKSFYLFSTNPFSPDSIKGAALRALENIHRSNIIIVPKTDMVDDWIKHNLHISDIPEIPSFIQKTQKTGDGSAS